jgi:hypothetical protein
MREMMKEGLCGWGDGQIGDYSRTKGAIWVALTANRG